MSNIDWRIWVMDKLKNDAAVTALLPADSWFAASSMEQPPVQRPFGVVRMDPERPGPFKGRSVSGLVLWVHDEPGTYMTIDAILNAAKDALCGPGAREGQARAAGGGIVVWQGHSGDLADQDYGTILRTSSYDLNGRDGNA